MGRVFITGDSHYKEEYKKVEDQCRIAGTTKEDLLIILGDHGCLYYGPKKDRRMKKYLESLPITFMMIKGNHDQRPSESLCEVKYIDRPEVKGNFYIEPEYPSIMYTAMYGYYRILGKKAFVLGGAYSVDRDYRLTMYDQGFHNYRWFYDEQMSPEEQRDSFTILQSSQEPWDYIFSHTCPMRYEPYDKFIGSVDQGTVDKTMEMWFDKIEETVSYKKWFCGHYHTDRISTESGGKLRLMYDDVIELEEYDEV